ncbi:Rabenosyn-5, partial [Armadillidium vulgare]
MCRPINCLDIGSMIYFYSLANNKNISYENELGKNIIDGFICQEEFCLTNNFLLVDLYLFTDEFHHVRTALISKKQEANEYSSVAETNKLLIRLDKLLTQIPSDPVKRKAVEREIVPWIENKDVPLCPFCAKSFNITRRRHHCRVCGAIMCDDCSQSLSFSYAQKLISPVHQGSSQGTSGANKTEERTHSGPFGSLLGNFQGLKRSGSHGSLNSLISVIDSMGKEQAFRICGHCMSRLCIRDKQVELRTSKTLLSIYYEKLMDYRNQLTAHVPQYLKMVNSLMEGETTYNISDAEELRMSILKLSDTISMTAQKIRTLGASGVAFEHVDDVTSDGNSAPAHPRQEMLQKRIHASTVSFLKENVLGLPKLPLREEIYRRQEQRRKERDAKLAAEREAARFAEERAASILRAKRAPIKENNSKLYHQNSNSSSASSSSSTPKRTYINVDTGWGADTSAHMVTETDDPIVQQMNIIRNYIRQARYVCYI